MELSCMKLGRVSWVECLKENRTYDEIHRYSLSPWVQSSGRLLLLSTRVS